MVDNYRYELQMQGLTLEQYFEFTKGNLEDLKMNIQPQAINMLKSRYLLEAIVEKENIEVSDDEITAEIKKMAEMYNITEEEVKRVISSFIGEIEQIPPMYSAIQLNGERLYNLARQGIDVERKARKITVFSIDIREINLPYVKISVHCSKGTYIRTLAADIGDALGCGGCISELCRTASGDFCIENAITPDELLALGEKGEAEKAIIPLDTVFKKYEAIYLDKKRADRVKNGVPIYFRGKTQGDFFRIYDENGCFIALSQSDIADGRECLKLIKGFYQ